MRNKYDKLNWRIFLGSPATAPPPPPRKSTPQPSKHQRTCCVDVQQQGPVGYHRLS